MSQKKINDIILAGKNYRLKIQEDKEKLHPEDLDFWDKYPVEEPESETSEEIQEIVIENDPATDGKHTFSIQKKQLSFLKKCK